MSNLGIFGSFDSKRVFGLVLCCCFQHDHSRHIAVTVNTLSEALHRVSQWVVVDRILTGFVSLELTSFDLESILATFSIEAYLETFGLFAKL